MTDKNQTTITENDKSTSVSAKEDASKTGESAKKDQTSKKNTEATSQPVKKKGNKRATAAIIIAILLAGSIGAYEFNQYQQDQHNQKVINLLKAQVSSLSEQLSSQQGSTEAALKKSADSLTNKLETQAKQQHDSIKSLQVAMADIKGRSPNDWLLAEADYLVKMAGRKLFLEHDIETATQLMSSADRRIASLNDPQLVGLREAMKDDINELKSLPIIDREGLILNLISLQKEVDQLPLANALLPKAEVVEETVVSDDINDWQSNLKTSLKDFAGHFITFRTRNGTTTPLLSPEQHFYLRENIKAKLETAIKGVYAENNDIYQTSLGVANDWSVDFFNQSSTKVIAFQKQLEQLKTQDITVNYPTKLVAQQELTTVISERLRRSVTPIGEGDK